MRSKVSLGVCIRLMGLYFLVLGVVAVARAMGSVIHPEDNHLGWLEVIPAAVELGMACLLMFGGDWIARLIARFDRARVDGAAPGPNAADSELVG